MRTLLLSLTLLVTGCTSEAELGTLSKSEAEAAYSTMRARLREADSLVLSADRPPMEYEYGCASGTIDMRISLDAMMAPTVLQHAFSSCELDSLTFDGTIFYRNIDPCGDDGSFAMSVYGRIDLGGAMNGFCEIQARDNCGELSGHVCGFGAGDLVITTDAAR